MTVSIPMYIKRCTHMCDLQELTSDPEVWELLVNSSWKSQFTSNYHTSGADFSSCSHKST